MNILLIGNGGREHALAYSISRSELTKKLYIAPGNGGTNELGENVDIKADEIDKLLAFALDKKIDLTIVGPEIPLCMGIVDLFNDQNLKIIGPNRKASKLEGSKIYSKEFMLEMGIPTANYIKTSDYDEALGKLDEFSYPLVIKADGLASGKGVLIPETRDEALLALDDILLKKKFGDSGNEIIIEEFLDGVEVSLICLTDGKTIIPLESARDYKRAFDNDKGLNTGGMGSFSPNPSLTPDILAKAYDKVLNPFLAGLKTFDLDFIGVLFVGLMIKDNDIKVLEFNVRFGDPETQVILPRLDSDIVDVFCKMYDRELDKVTLKWKKESCVSVVAASAGYPESFETGKLISGLSDVDCMVFHGGTKLSGDKHYTNGGRVLNVVSLADNIKTASEKVYNDIEKINFDGLFYRSDIAKL
ncbi:MAG: phosphoribosylamine--glycine ligase [Acidaminobacteraceae bacterium]